VLRELRSPLGRHQPKPIDPEAEKRLGWRERELVRQLGVRFYGRRAVEPNG
jgi:hypothetical protein